MPRAKIDYPALRNALYQKYPYPLYRYVTLLKPERYNDLKAPTAVYDRATGNYKRIGYKVQVSLEQFNGMYESENNFLGYKTQYVPRTFETVLLID